MNWIIACFVCYGWAFFFLSMPFPFTLLGIMPLMFMVTYER